MLCSTNKGGSAKGGSACECSQGAEDDDVTQAMSKEGGGVLVNAGCPVVPHFPHFQNFVHILKRFPHFPHFWENPLKDGYGSILTKKCVI